MSINTKDNGLENPSPRNLEGLTGKESLPKINFKKYQYTLKNFEKSPIEADGETNHLDDDHHQNHLPHLLTKMGQKSRLPNCNTGASFRRHSGGRVAPKTVIQNLRTEPTSATRQPQQTTAVRIRKNDKGNAYISGSTKSRERPSSTAIPRICHLWPRAKIPPTDKWFFNPIHSSSTRRVKFRRKK